MAILGDTVAKSLKVIDGVTGTPKAVTAVSAATEGNALINSTNTNYGAIFNAPTKDYRVSLATSPSVDNLVYMYSFTNAKISAQTNTPDKSLTWNAGTGVLTATSFSGPLTGNVTGNVTGTATGLQSVTTSSGTHKIYFTSGQPAIGTGNGNSYKGSSNNIGLICFPENGTSWNSTTGNVQNIRLVWDGNYFSDIFCSPNNHYVWHRNVMSGTAYGWRRLVEENVDNITSPNWNINIAGNAATATSAGSATSATSAGKLTTARSLKTALNSTTAVTFDGSADQNAIPVTGTLGAGNGGTGQTTLKDACNGLLNALDTGSSTPVDADYYISQYVNGGTTTKTYHRRPMSALYAYIKGKTDTLYAAKATTLAGYNISDAKIASGVITLGSNTITPLPLSGGTMTGRILTSYKSSVAIGSYHSATTTIPDLAEEIRYSSGVCGSVNITTAYTKDNITIPIGWYNYLWIPHRTGGLNGEANGDNCNFGSLYLSGMTLSGCYMIRYASSAIAEVRNLYADTNTTYSAGTGLSLSSTTINHSNSVTAATAGTSSATSGSTLAVPYVTYDAQGHITATGTHTHTITGFATTDTKNTAGSTDTSSKIFLIGATSQAANPQTYSDNEVYATSGVLTTKSVQVGGTACTLQYNSTNQCLDFVFA